MKILPFVIASLLLASCGSVPVKLEAGSESVSVVDYIKPDQRGKFKEVDKVKCQLGDNARTWEANVEGCKNKLRNEAAKMGADLVLVTENDIRNYSLGSGRSFLNGSKECANCVEMSGIVYKKK